MDGEKIKSGKVDEVSPYELIPEKCSSVHEPVQTTPAWPGVHADAREVALHRWAGGSGRPGRPPARRMAGQFSAPWVPCGSSLATLLVPSFSFSARRYVYALSTLKPVGIEKCPLSQVGHFGMIVLGKDSILGENQNVTVKVHPQKGNKNCRNSKQK